MRNKSNALRNLKRLQQSESEVVGREFIALLLRSNKVTLRLNGTICTLRVNTDFEGVGLFRVVDLKTAEFIEETSRRDASDFLDLFRINHHILVQKNEDGSWITKIADQQFVFAAETARVEFVPDGLQQFDEVTVARVPNANIFKRRSRRIGRRARELRGFIGKDEPPKPESIQIKGLRPEERQAYSLAYDFWELNNVDQLEVRIRHTLQVNNAEYVSHQERDGNVIVRYIVDGHQHTTIVNPDNLGAVDAGICLSGEDRYFDLSTMVGVIRERERRW